MKRWLKYTLYTLLWLGVVAYIIFATFAVRTQRTVQRVDQVKIKIVDSSAVANLVTRSMVEKWIKESKIPTLDQPIDSLRLTDLEQYIADNGFVKQVKCFTTYNGQLHIEISQLRPTLRIMLDGFNSYITSQGEVFAAPPSSSQYTQVVTGSYSPLFRAGFTGNIEDVFLAGYEELAAEIKRSEVKNIYPLYAQRMKLREQLRAVNSRYTNRRFGERRKVFDERVEELRERNAKERAEITRALHETDLAIEKETSKQKVFIDKQKKLEKKYQDFINLITFVNVVENDKFWSSEIVQIVATESTNSDLRLELIPRSGEHTIVFGLIEEVEEKLSQIKTFYKEVLPREGWQKYKVINVEYKGQIVCK
ncbi:MAG: hypothetical protein SNH73_02880 [Rikenellaceae bacterium]